MGNAFVFKHACFDTQKEIMQCYPPIYNSPTNIKMILYMDANTNRNFASAFGTHSAATSLSTDLSITKGDTLADKYIK